MEKKTSEISAQFSPFQERVNVNLFFSGAQRRKILDEIKKSIIDGYGLITLAGDEGTGKTMLCRMVEKELPDDFTPVYLANILESFDDVVRAIALKLDTDNSDKAESTTELVLAITANLQENDRRLVLIFDQAERMYLATIERIRKMLDRVNTEEERLQIVFSGRVSLLENLKQLKICDFGEVKEKDYILNPFGLSETYAYLNHCVQQKFQVRGKNIFTPEIAKKIYSLAQGNLRMTNMLAAKTLETAETDTSFAEMLENMQPKAQKRSRAGGSTAGLLRARKKRELLFGGVAFLVCALLLYLFVAEDDRGVLETADTGNQQISGEAGTAGSASAPPEKDEAAEIVIVDSSGEAPDKGDARKDLPASAPQEGQEAISQVQAENKAVADRQNGSGLSPGSGPSETVALQERDETAVADEIPDSTKIAVAPLAVKDRKVDDSADAKRTGAEITRQSEADSKTQNETVGVDRRPVEETGTVAESEASPSDGPAELPTEDALREVVIFAEMKKRMPPGIAETEGAKRITRIAPVKLKVVGDADEQEPGGNSNAEDIDLLQLRMDAGASWLDKEDSGLHTIQLMVLTADQAQENLRKRFEEQNYQDIADELFIIKNADSEVYVYFGEYPDIDTARQARNTLPLFLREYDPYALPVKEAVNKARSQE